MDSDGRPTGVQAHAGALLPPQAGAAGEGAPPDISLLVAPDFTLRCVHPGEPQLLPTGRAARMQPLLAVCCSGICFIKTTSRSPSCLLHRLVLPCGSSLVCRAPIGPVAVLPAPAGDGWEQWQHRFDAPPVAAFAAGSERIDLLAQGQQRRGAVRPAAGAVAPAYGALLPPKGKAGGSGTDSGGGAVGSDAVVLVSQNGSVFGIPASHLTFEAAGDGSALAVAEDGEQCQVPTVERQAQGQPQQRHSRGVGDAASALALLPHHPQAKQQPPGGPGARQCRPAEDDVCSAAPLGVYPLQQPGSRTALLLLPAGRTAAVDEAARQHPQARSGGQRSWLVLLAGVGAGAATSALVLVFMRRRKDAAHLMQAQAAAAAAAGSNGITSAAAAAAASFDAGGASRGRRRGSSTKKQQPMSNRLKGIVQQAAVEAPPAAASQAAQQQTQQQAQQQQQQQQAQQQQQQQPLDDSLPSDAALAAGLTDPAMRRRQMTEDGVIAVGRLRVGPGVLGYGSGGTVVFAGELDGRPVAVKRVLRQFYEMARKEIDALILADEHPNIVRWGPGGFINPQGTSCCILFFLLLRKGRRVAFCSSYCSARDVVLHSVLRVDPQGMSCCILFFLSIRKGCHVAFCSSYRSARDVMLHSVLPIDPQGMSCCILLCCILSFLSTARYITLRPGCR